MSKKNIIIVLSLFLVTSCLIDITDKIPVEVKSKLNYPVIFVEDSLINLNIEKSYIFKSGYQGNAYAYGDLLKLENGNILLACNASKLITDWTESNIVISISSDNGKTWSNPSKIEHSTTESVINRGGASLINIGDGHLMLFFLVKYSNKRIDIMYKESFNFGVTWGNDQIVYKTEQGYTTTNNNRVHYNNNRILVPVAVPNDPNNLFQSVANNMSVFYYYSDDLGKTWVRSNNLTLPDVALLEPDLISINSSEILMNIRLNLGYVLFARSKDNGHTWSFEYSNINSVSSPQKILKLGETDNLLMVWNYNKEGNANDHAGNRNPLSLGISKDKGYLWKHIADIENNSEYDYSYPSMNIIEDTLYLTYYEIWKGKSNYSLKLAKIATKDLRNE